MSDTAAANRGRVRARADDDDVPEYLKCSVCLDAPVGRTEQCANGEPTSNAPSFFLCRPPSRILDTLR
jgi:hypothetical protein